MPINDFVFTSVDDVMDFSSMNKVVANWISKNVEIREVFDVPINYSGYGDVETLKGDSKILLYVTGLTSATAAFIAACAANGISLSLMHYDKSDGEYKEQRIF